MIARTLVGIAVAALAATACGGASSNAIVRPRDVPEAGDAPKVARVQDLGDMGQIPAPGKSLPKPDSDGEFVVGELVLIRGDDFGKLPTVQIGGRPAVVEARTGGGGIITRIPPGVPTGTVQVEVSHPGGKHAVSIDVHRFAFVVQPNEGKLHLLRDSGSGTPSLVRTVDMPGVRGVAYAADGQAAYALVDTPAKGANGQLAVIVLPAAGGPKVVRKLVLPMQAPMFVETAASAPLAAVVDRGTGVLVDLTDSRNPALHEPFQLGLEGDVPHSLALDADGKTLTVLVSEGNRIVPFDVSTPSQPQRRTEAVAVPQVRHPVLSAMTYSPAGDQLWAVAGDTQQSIAAGKRPTTIISVDVAHGQQAPLSAHPGASVAGAGAPVVAASSRREAIAPGTSIRSASKTAAVVVATVHSSLLALAGKPVRDANADSFKDIAEPGVVLRTDLEGEAKVLFATSGVVTGLAITHDSRTVAAATTRIVREGGALSLEFGVTFVPLAGGEATYVRLGDVSMTADILVPASVALAP